VRSTVTPDEGAVLQTVALDNAWEIVERFSQLERASGSTDERVAVDEIRMRLADWDISHALHEPELLVSIPGPASLLVDEIRYDAKTPAKAASTDKGGVVAPLAVRPRDHGASVYEGLPEELLEETDVRGAIVVTDGFPMAAAVEGVGQAGAAGVVCMSPGARIHQGICASVWGSPDLTTVSREPTIPVVAISQSDGRRLLEQLAARSRTGVIVAEHDTGWRPIPVLVAEIRGSDEPDRFVLLHGHIDSWHVGVGDNATGDATLLEVARVLQQHRARLRRTVRVAWWSGHSHGRYAGSTWYADTFAADLERNCICHINCDSPGCRDADVFDDMDWMPETAEFAQRAILDFTGLPSAGRRPTRAGDLSFSNVGVSSFFMLSSAMSRELRADRGLYRVAGCGGNIEWHTEADTIEIADRGRLLRDMKLYAGATFRAANAVVHPLDFRETIAEMRSALATYEQQAGSLGEFSSTRKLLATLDDALADLYGEAASVTSIGEARLLNDALLRIGRRLVRALNCRREPDRHDPAGEVSPLPQLADALAAIGSQPSGVVRTELVRARNRIDRALWEALESVSLPAPPRPRRSPGPAAVAPAR
jgi:N-acetylated-alpha-linked acidic dipeptidase